MIAFDESCQRCDRFRDAVVSRYELLISNKNLVRNGPPVSLDDIAATHIPSGISFDEAEGFLARSGFKTSPRPGRETKGMYSDRYDVYAISDNLVKPPAPGFSINVVVLLRPASPDDYSRVLSVHSYINVIDF
jgi:hypothetical protein